jgi:hypothetical protein
MAEELKTDDAPEETAPVPASDQVTGDTPEEDVTPEPTGDDVPTEDEPTPDDAPAPDLEPTEDAEDLTYGKRVRKRIGVLKEREMKALKRAEEAEAENRRLKGDSPATFHSTFSKPEPRIEDYEDDPGGYTKALSQWTYDKARADDIEREKAARADEDATNVRIDAVAEDKAIIGAFVEQINESGIKEKYKDYDDIVPDSPYPDDAAGTKLKHRVMRSDQGLELAYYLAKNPEKILDLHSLSADDQLREIWALESRLKTNSTTKRETNAPPPIETVTGNDAPRIADAKLAKKDPRAYIRKQNKRQFGVEFG